MKLGSHSSTSRPAVWGQGSRRQSVRVQARGARYDRKKPPPPDLPSLLFDQRIVYLGMPVSGHHPTMQCNPGSLHSLPWPSGEVHDTRTTCIDPSSSCSAKLTLSALQLPMSSLDCAVTSALHMPAACASSDRAHGGRAALPGKAGLLASH